MRGKNKISLQFKVLSLISVLLLVIILLLAGIFSYILYVDSRTQAELLVLQTAKTISLMPELYEAIKEDNLEEIFRPIAEQVKDQANASNIVIENRERIIYSHSDLKLVGQRNSNHTNDQALIFGGSSSFEIDREQGRVIVGKVPIIADYSTYSQVIGTVSVEFLEKDLLYNLYKKIKFIIFASLGVFILGIIGGIYLTNNIRKDTLGLEPHEISSLFRERNAILSSIKEGIIAINERGLITMINLSASDMLNICEKHFINQHIHDILPNIKIDLVLETGQDIHNVELLLHDKMYIFNFIPIIEQEQVVEQVVGVVLSFRDKTELKKLIDTISEVRTYSEGLRAQTHEYANKLYLLSGLLQLEKYQDALDFINKESTIHHHQTKLLFNQIQDLNIQAILLGKLGRASEMKIHFEIDPESYVDPLPKHIGVTEIITIIGNLIDNAFESVIFQDKRNVSFSITNLGNEIIIEVTDSGKGLSKEQFDTLFAVGFSSKGENRGYGLYNVKRIVDALNGNIDVINGKEGGAIFTVFLPKGVK
ncbi:MULTISPECIES: ATP-binding protein [Bacillaceae]|uniref:ATP-binding protein n=1 Tax=Bacillaceae TaxID=186817 RepID=UPI000BFC9DD9|nr:MULTISPECIES: sensor histidine kinase [Bacillaceae]PGT81769.1 ATPase [Bacillus sp. AFS040349]UGB33322.1 sensor histidine kinase [Metabacillus sp. B2-18]